MSARYHVIDPHGCQRAGFCWLSEARRYLATQVRASERGLWRIEGCL